MFHRLDQICELQWLSEERQIWLLHCPIYDTSVESTIFAGTRNKLSRPSKQLTPARIFLRARICSSILGILFFCFYFHRYKLCPDSDSEPSEGRPYQVLVHNHHPLQVDGRRMEERLMDSIMAEILRLHQVSSSHCNLSKVFYKLAFCFSHAFQPDFLNSEFCKYSRLSWMKTSFTTTTKGASVRKFM